MDNKNDLILQLARMLQSNGPKTSVCKMPDKDYVSKVTNGDGFESAQDLKIFLNNRLQLTDVDPSNAKIFLLMPYEASRWKVFVVDGNDVAYAQLDDYCGKIIERIDDNKEVFRTDTFVVSK